MKKKYQFKKYKINITPITVILITYIAYYLLLHDNFMHTSIASIIDVSNQLAVKPHLLVLGLLPIYIAIMIFGAGLLGIYFGSMLDHFLARLFKRNKKHK